MKVEEALTFDEYWADETILPDAHSRQPVSYSLNAAWNFGSGQRGLTCRLALKRRNSRAPQLSQSKETRTKKTTWPENQIGRPLKTTARLFGR